MHTHMHKEETETKKICPKQQHQHTVQLYIQQNDLIELGNKILQCKIVKLWIIWVDDNSWKSFSLVLLVMDRGREDD